VKKRQRKGKSLNKKKAGARKTQQTEYDEEEGGEIRYPRACTIKLFKIVVVAIS
jgi:hypothetical protein